MISILIYLHKIIKNFNINHVLFICHNIKVIIACIGQNFNVEASLKSVHLYDNKKRSCDFISCVLMSISFSYGRKLFICY